MSLEKVKLIFQEIKNCTNWSVFLLCYNHSKRNGTTYNCRKIELEPDDRTNKLINSISETYTNDSKNRLSSYVDVREYDGTCNGTTIYKISEEDNNVDIDLAALFQGIANLDVETDPMTLKPQAYGISGEIKLDGQEHQIKLISMNSPITILKNRFLHNQGKFFEIDKKVLNLRTSINVLIFDKTVYFMDMSGETLFNMERAYRNKCNEAVAEIKTMAIISDISIFESTATTGQNPRRFTSFSKSKLQLLSQKKNRDKAAKYFNIPLTADKKMFDTSDKNNAEKLVKLLCGKAMWDIIEEKPVEVDGTKVW